MHSSKWKTLMLLRSTRPVLIPKTSICLQKSPYMVTRFFMWAKPNVNITVGGSSINWWINHVCQKYLEPNRKKVKILSSFHQSPKCSTVHLKLVLIYRNTSITATDNEFYAMPEEILFSQQLMYHHGWFWSSKHRLDTAETNSHTRQ